MTTMKSVEKELEAIATDLALENNNFYTAADIPQFKQRLIDALLKGGWLEVQREKMRIKYA